MARLALRTRDPSPADALAREATRGRLDERSLLTATIAGELSRALAPGRRQLLHLAAVWAATPGSPDRIQGAALVFEDLWHGPERGRFRPEHHLLAGQTMFLSGRHAALTQILPDLTLHRQVRQSLETDLLNPWTPTTAGRGDLTQWHTRFSAPFRAEGHVPPAVNDDESALPFDRLTAPEAKSGVVGGPLVTVIMPCYQPDRGLLTSVRSMIAQTYGDLEILMVDDASGPEYDDLFDEACDLDSRITRITLEENGGSYLAREAALAQATGSLVTFQDADDWSHPSRIEQQVSALQADKASVSRSLALRAHDDLSMQWLGYPPIRRNASSLLLTRAVIDRWGGFVPIRKGADSELAERLETLDGAIADTETLLAITRLRQGSLSRADFTHSWMAPDRIAFRSSFRAWHRSLLSERVAPGLLDTETLHRLPFAVPRTFLRNLPGAALVPEHYSTIVLGDFSHDDEAIRGWLMTMLSTTTGPLALWHQEAPVDPTITRPTMSAAWADLIQKESRVFPITRLDRVEAETVLVIDPEVLAVTSAQENHVRAKRVIMFATPELLSPDASLLPADILGLGDRAHSWLRARPTWRAAPWLDAEQRRGVEQTVPGLLQPGRSGLLATTGDG